jgi:hypothetical protein
VATTTLPYPNPTSAEQYADDLDFELGATIPTKADLAVTTAWIEGESSTFPGFNGLGTKLHLPGSTNDPSNSQGVQDYPNLQEGLQAAVDMIEGKGPQTTPDAPAFAKDIASGKATPAQLVNDIYNSHWAGFSVPDAYDADTIAAKLGIKAPTATTPASGAPGNHSWFSTIVTLGGHLPGGGVITDVTTAPEKAVDSVVGGIAGTVGNYILKGVLSLVGAGMIFYGATILTGRQAGANASAATLGGGAAGAEDEGAEESFWPDAAEAAAA